MLSGLLPPELPAGEVLKPSSRLTAGSALPHRGERTGESYMKIPVPSPNVLEQAPDDIASLLERFRSLKT